MSQAPRPPRSSTGHETSDALKAVLEDQSERKQRQGGAQPKPKMPSRAPGALAVILALLSVWLWLSPPSVLRPQPPAPLRVAVQESGLRMDLYMVAVRILSFQSSTGRLPANVEEAMPDPLGVDHFEYVVLNGGDFRISAVRGEQVVVYTSDRPLEELVGNAQRVLEGGNR